MLCFLHYSKRKFVNGPQGILYVIHIPTKHWISVTCLHKRFRFATCDIKLNCICCIKVIHNCDMLPDRKLKEIDLC